MRLIINVLLILLLINNISPIRFTKSNTKKAYERNYKPLAKPKAIYLMPNPIF